MHAVCCLEMWKPLRSFFSHCRSLCDCCVVVNSGMLRSPGCLPHVNQSLCCCEGDELLNLQEHTQQVSPPFGCVGGRSSAGVRPTRGPALVWGRGSSRNLARHRPHRARSPTITRASFGVSPPPLWEMPKGRCTPQQRGLKSQRLGNRLPPELCPSHRSITGCSREATPAERPI